MNFSDKVWNIVCKWEYFAKDTIGKQWVRAADSVAANISEGFGRFTGKDSKNFISLLAVPYKKVKHGL